MDLAVLALAFGAIFVVELPDKTFIAALVLSTRYPPLLVWLGVGAAFFVQTTVAVTAGSVVGLLPDTAVKSVSAAIFLLGAFLMFRASRSADEDEAEEEEEYAAKAAAPKHGFGVVVASFLVLFAAEWGDLSQLLTISLVAKYDDVVSVFLGAWGALLAVSGLAVLVGRFLLSHVRLATIFALGGTVCLALFGFTVYEIVS
ncbi:MAG TPA: TMEM165/GDT1 family protein [Nocardioidaceae bacterium]|nr:TMEM165/GDT1 family protein [Nocardioidaceae bacterium]